MLRLIIVLFIFIYSLPSFSVVDMRNGSYEENWIDFIEPTPGIDMRISRFYSSRSLFPGLFGFGWCSSLETNLNITSDGIINLVECGAGLEVTYYPKNFDPKSVEDTIEKIITDYKVKHKNLTSGDITNYKTQLRANTKMRFEYANRLNLIDGEKIRKNKNTFFSKSKGFEKIIFDGKNYKRVKVGGIIEKYNKEGKLIQLTHPSGQFIKINYKGSRIAFLMDNKGRRLTFTYGNNGKLAKISNGKNLSSSYKFSGENLVEVTNMWSKTYKFSYDANHNMTKVNFPDNTSMSMTYDSLNDWIRSYTNRKGCREEFNYFLDKDNPQNHYWGEWTRKCPTEVTYKGRHEFWYKNYSFSKSKYLHQVHVKYRILDRLVNFHPYLGKEVSIQENGTLYRGFAYYMDGLINKIENKIYTKNREIFKWDQTHFKHDRTKNRISSFKQKFLNKLGKVTDTRTLELKYNSMGYLSKAIEKNKDFLKIDYDENGKIETLKNRASETLLLTYRVGVDKPVEIEQKNVGKVKIAYTNNGEIDSVTSEGKRSLATSIVEKFLSFINFLGPFGEELKI